MGAIEVISKAPETRKEAAGIQLRVSIYIIYICVYIYTHIHIYIVHTHIYTNTYLDRERERSGSRFKIQLKVLSTVTVYRPQLRVPIQRVILWIGIHCRHLGFSSRGCRV